MSKVLKMSTQEEISRSKRCYSDEQILISTIQLPEDLLSQIFLRLPVKSLIRFRCLSKGMRGMIDSPIFVNNHNIYRSESERSLRDDYAILLGLSGYSPMYSVNFYKDNMNCAKAVELNCTLREGMSAIGGCNGIFCFMYALPESYVLWNPSNGTCRKVECSDVFSSEIVCSISSIGYDHVINDYKIFRFARMPINTVMKIYSFRNDSWREFTGKLPFDTFRPGPGVCVVGAMHWLAYPTNSSIFIAAFDFVTETFKSLPLPVEARERELEPCGIMDFRGRLCITFYSSVYDNGAHTLWVMEKYGVERSWTKLYIIICLENFYYPNKEERPLLYYGGQLVWWDPQHDSLERIEFSGPMDDQPEPFVYVRNLIRLDQSCI